ncbi:3'-5' RNA helicase YTHDC2-like [Adelges cooleyi]|uniref:3'-5' RNA helicase YTHDC2-like n=1 Tax=Adelges cooleyi TaxID=133065 RepID=UPI002180351A|nr:3'-5' RNA helicase YTHDC2-like [Adelges cooleyi]
MTEACRENPSTTVMNEQLVSNPMPPFQQSDSKTTLPFMSHLPMVVPQLSSNKNLICSRMRLPIMQKNELIIQLIENNPVIIISGETGCGKTTQVPQMIIDHSATTKRPSRVVCCQPRRIAAISMAHRVSNERGEKIGTSVGYQVRFQSCLGSNATITYCTIGILTRALVIHHQNDNEPIKNMFMNISHIIIDEVHERTKHVDFLLVALRMILPRYPHLKLILMSASADIRLFSSYFYDCPVLQVNGRLFPVQQYFLEDVLDMTNYSTPTMIDLVLRNNPTERIPDTNNLTERTTESSQNMRLTIIPNTALSHDQEWLKPELDECLQKIWRTGDIAEVNKMIYHYIRTEGVPVNYQHTSTGVTLLMSIVIHSLDEYVLQLLHMGADPTIQNNFSPSKSAAALAASLNHFRISDMIKNFNYVPTNNPPVILDKMQRLGLYKEDILHGHIDSHLTTHLIRHLILYKPFGSILVFLTGYSDIAVVENAITEDLIKKHNFKIEIYKLHSLILDDRKRVFLPAPEGYRKVVLATNIAETSVTINDIVYVIDSGKVKQPMFNFIERSHALHSKQISHSCAMQRAGRAGRLCAGEYYCFYTLEDFIHMKYYDEPEIKMIPLEELSLLAKAAARSMRVEDFLSLAIEPPSHHAVKKSLGYLKAIEAMDTNENITDLGYMLLDLSIEPHHAKILIFGLFLKCIDPVLFIVSFLANKYPFNLNLKTSEVWSICKNLAEDTLSDHFVFIRLYQAITKPNISEEIQKAVCPTVIDQIKKTRYKLLTQLKDLNFIQTMDDLKDFNTNSSNWAAVKACVLAGSYPNLSMLEPRSEESFTTRIMSEVLLHGSSVLHGTNFGSLPSKWIVFEQLCSCHGRKRMRNCSVISSLTVLLFANAMQITPCIRTIEIDDVLACIRLLFLTGRNVSMQSHIHLLALDGWIKLSADLNDLEKMLNIRLCLTLAYREFLKNKTLPNNSMHSRIVQTVVKLLEEEDLAMGLTVPEDIGN